MVEQVSRELVSFFECLIKVSGGVIGTALSGGYDTRLMLAILRSLGHTPYMYVYGHLNSSDVNIATMISRGEHLPLEHIDKSEFKPQTSDSFASCIEQQIYFFDGIKPLGIVDDGSDLTSRFDRANKANLQLNGAGGEIYREIWNLSDRNINLLDFIKMRFDRGTYEFCHSPFDTHVFFETLSQKIQHILQIDRSWLTRREAEILFPFLRNYFASANNAANNQISYSLIPFMEPKFIFPSLDIPIKYKYCGEFQAKLIKLLDPDLAKYPSSYGINFFDPIPFQYKLLRSIERNIPLKLRLLKRSFVKPSGKPPYFYEKEYLGAIVDLKNPKISQFVNLDKINDTELYSRALSIELLLSKI
jgi:asparagine synthase (glutamine-hydrolysing)